MEYSDFFLKAFIYLLAAVLSVPLAKRLGFGSVLGYIIAGIIIGPFVFGLIGKDSKEVMHFSEFGVVMMLFLIGLELRPALLWKLRTQILGIGLLQVLLTTLVIGAIFYLAGESFSISLAIGMILSLSSTAIVMQIFTEKGWIKVPVGKTTFSVLLFQDIAVIPMMAILPLLGLSHGLIDKTLVSGAPDLTVGLMGWQKAILIGTVITSIVLSGRYLVCPLFRFIAHSKSREIFTAAALLLVIANALAMQMVGVSPALGTFLAGVVLAESEYRHELEIDIEPFKGLLLGLFFITVGASINFPFLLNNPFIVIKFCLLLIVTKSAILYFVSRLFKRTKQDSLLFAIALSQGGEFCFVLLSYAMRNRVLPPSIADPLIMVVAISMILTPVLVMLYEKILEPYFIRIQEQRQTVEGEVEKNPVIIVGFGRFGQIIGRLLMANRIRATIFDLNHRHIELVKEFGFKGIYGDATRIDLLKLVDLSHAKLFIIAIDDTEQSLQIALSVRKYFPHIKILTRVRDRKKAFEFLRHGFESVYQEVFDASLVMGIDALRILGFPGHQAVRSAHLLRRFDDDMLKRLAKTKTDEQTFMKIVKANQINLQKIFKADYLHTLAKADNAWDRNEEKAVEMEMYAHMEETIMTAEVQEKEQELKQELKQEDEKKKEEELMKIS